MVNLFGNQEKKRSHFDKEIRRKERVTENVLDAVIQIISLVIVQNHLTTKIKRLSLEVLGAIAKMTPKIKPTTKLVLWLNRQMRLCEISLKIINKNKILKTKRDLLEKENLELNEKIKKLERSKEIEIACKSCDELKLENAKLNETQVKFVKFDKSANSLREMLNNQKSPSFKISLGFDSDKASTSGTKTMSFVGSFAEKATNESTIKGHESTLPGSVCLRTCLEPDEWIKDSGCSKHMTGNKSLFSTYKAYDGGIFLGYSQNSKAYVVLNKHTIKVKESLNVTFDGSSPPTKLSPLVDDDVSEEEAIRKNNKIVNTNNEEDGLIELDEIVNIKESKNHPLDQVIGNLNQRNLRSRA
uniref:Transposon protein, putative, CACTA, En/Spm sub-class n=1 Tax=Tanacetum cinerariifolium TaxID=118510 RepID=A0A699GV99_TANCI|nr:transposon protein, putative, CACTA, En/Spm sub-class [Tanacetum cinerariifolium]